MGFIKRTVKRIWIYMVECGTFSVVFAKAWKKFWRIMDLIISIIPRLIVKYSSKVDDKKVFFYTQENFYTCNPKYITEELLKRRTDTTVVWRGSAGSNVPGDVKTVKFNSYEYFKEMYSSKVVVTNSSLFLRVPVFLKKNQYLIETWHGSLGLKKWSKDDVKDSLIRIFALEQTGRMTDYCISNSTLEDGSMRATYWPDTPILRLGHARNDIFFDNYAEKRDSIRRKVFDEYDVPEDAKIVMYAPTFRDRVEDLSYFSVDYEKVIDALTRRFPGEWYFFVRLHPSMRKMSKQLGLDNKKRIINVTEYPDMQELAAITDVAITDYSSWIYDFVLSRRPGFIFATDIDEYQKEDRGFYYPIEETPFPIARNNKELISNIEQFDMEGYLNEVDAFLLDKGCIDDGHASERVVDFILDIVSGKIDKKHIAPQTLSIEV